MGLYDVIGTRVQKTNGTLCHIAAEAEFCQWLEEVPSHLGEERIQRADTCHARPTYRFHPVSMVLDA